MDAVGFFCAIKSTSSNFVLGILQNSDVRTEPEW
uniref:Uncharacterized protein n=1 Tax=Rhizophora mucronata TaxID=61149 RepID=A0A2P2KC24_RHIMU